MRKAAHTTFPRQFLIFPRLFFSAAPYQFQSHLKQKVPLAGSVVDHDLLDPTVGYDDWVGRGRESGQMARAGQSRGSPGGLGERAF